MRIEIKDQKPETKTFNASVQLKADEEAPGTVLALVSAFGNVDLGGDRMIQGAFKRTLEEDGLPPVVWSHMWDVPPIGQTLEANETDAGLLVKFRLFVGEGEDHQVARQVYAAMKGGALKEFSFGYVVTQATYVEEEDSDHGLIREIEEVKLIEVGPCLRGMNPATQTFWVKDNPEPATVKANSDAGDNGDATGTAPAATEEQPAEPQERDPRITRLLNARPYH